MRTAQPNRALVPGAIPEGTVLVTRGWGDPRTIPVVTTRLRNVHNATDEGGARRRLRRTMLAGYIDCDLIPAGVPFGHSCQHGAGPHSIKVLIRCRDNAPAAIRRLRELAAGAKLRRNYRAGAGAVPTA
jgi:hypothetical protein